MYMSSKDIFVILRVFYSCKEKDCHGTLNRTISNGSERNT